MSGTSTIFQVTSEFLTTENDLACTHTVLYKLQEESFPNTFTIVCHRLHNPKHARLKFDYQVESIFPNKLLIIVPSSPPKFHHQECSWKKESTVFLMQSCFTKASIGLAVGLYLQVNKSVTRRYTAHK